MSERFDEIRESITAVDVRIVESLNERLRLVTELWELKLELGLDEVDPDRERQLRELLAAANHGPLSREGLEQIVTAILDLTKAELRSRRDY